MKTLVIIPTYNEAGNIESLIRDIYKKSIDCDILVVDDNSPDGTGAIVKSLQSEYPRLHILERPGKSGLAKAYLAGFKWGFEKDYDWFVEMDADFSHRPEDLKKIIESFPKADFVVGSRYTEGGGTANWGLGRKIISKGGSFYARTILGYPLYDWTGGFNAWSRQALEAINLESVRSEGYSFQIELKYKALKRGQKALEVPILFEDRRAGESKMSLKIVVEAFYRVWVMRFV